jgi:hypothetical protein
MTAPWHPHNDRWCGFSRFRPSRNGEQISWSKIFRAEYSAANRLERFRFRDNLDGLRSADPVEWGLNGVHPTRGTDEEAGFRNSPDLVTCMGPNEIAAQKRDRARRSLRAHWPDRGRQIGLFDEVRQFAGAAVTAG